jgi:hypothetical protein
MSAKAEEELIRVSHEWDRAMVENDADAIGMAALVTRRRFWDS